jgi:glycosyltransferase involved in cell wall biosynthesis
MRIVHVIGFFQPHFGYEEAYTSVQQAALGHEVHVVTSERLARLPGLTSAERRVGTGIQEYRGVFVHRLPSLEIPGDLIYMRGALQLIQRLAPDVVHAHGIHQPVNLMLPRLKRRNRFCLVYDFHYFPLPTFHHRTPLELAKAVDYRVFRRWAARRALRRADAIVPTAPACRNQLVEFFGISPDRLDMIELGVDVETFDFDEEGGRAVREQYGIPTHAHVLLFAGFFAPHKRIDALLEILQILPPTFHLLLVGGGDAATMEGLWAGARARGVTNRMHVTGIQPTAELKRYYSAADLGVFITWSSVSTLEVMACGVPVVLGGEVPFLREAVLKGQGVILASSDPTRIADEILSLTTDREQLRRRGQMSRDYIRKERSYRAYAERLLQLYERVSPLDIFWAE